jgi:hypothetical protein
MAATDELEPGPRYALYADLPPAVATMIATVKEALKLKGTVEPSTEEPHFTILFGPRLLPDEKEALSREDAILVYPCIGSLLPDPSRIAGDALPADVVYRGVSHFVREKEVHIHLEFESPTLTAMHVFLRETADLERDYAYYHEHAGGDSSYANPPRRWLHVSIASVPRTAHWQDVVVQVEEVVRDLVDQHWTPELARFRPEGFAVISAVTDTRIPL